MHLNSYLPRMNQQVLLPAILIGFSYYLALEQTDRLHDDTQFLLDPFDDSEFFGGDQRKGCPRGPGTPCSADPVQIILAV